jgi:hypothetical protein
MAEKKRERVSRREQRRQEMAVARRNRTLMLALPAVIIAVGLIALIVYRAFEPDIQGSVRTGNLDRGHENSVDIPASPLPPVGGVHTPTWLNCGIYNQPVDTVLALHSMEHGGVWIAYQPDLPAEEVATLKSVAQGDNFVLMSPYEGLASKVVLTAWGVQLELDSATDERVELFVNRYRNQGPELGATCSNGVGVPTG